MHKTVTFFFLSLVLLCFSCYDKPEVEKNPWSKIDGLVTIGPIRTMHAGPFGIYAITDEEFVKTNLNNEVVERRSVDLPTFFFGRPTIGDWTMARYVEKGGQNIVELHLTQTEGEIYDLIINDLSLADGSKVEFYDSGRDVGAFNSDGSQLAFPVKVNNLDGSSNVGLVMVKIEQSTNHDAFTVVEVRDIVSIREMSANSNELSTIKFVNGAYYITHQDGAFRITQSGSYAKVANGWVLDVFAHQGRLYLTSNNDADFFVSQDNGQSFERVGYNSPAKYVSQSGNYFVHQRHLGFEFKLIDNDYKELKDLQYNTSIQDQNDNAAFWNFVYFGGKHYISVQKEIFYIDDLVEAD